MILGDPTTLFQTDPVTSSPSQLVVRGLQPPDHCKPRYHLIGINPLSGISLVLNAILVSVISLCKSDEAVTAME